MAKFKYRIMNSDGEKINGNYEANSKEEVIEKYMDLYENKIAQEDFILNISHDLRSPLSVILGILQCYKNEGVINYAFMKSANPNELGHK